MHQAALQSNEALQAYPMRPSGRRGRTLSPAPRGAKPPTPHGPLQRLLGTRKLLARRARRPPFATRVVQDIQTNGGADRKAE